MPRQSRNGLKRRWECAHWPIAPLSGVIALAIDSNKRIRLAFELRCVYEPGTGG
jgi:hypothetical protein